MLKNKSRVVRLSAPVTLECIYCRPAFRAQAFLWVARLREGAASLLLCSTAPQNQSMSLQEMHAGLAFPPPLSLGLLPSARCQIGLTAGRQRR